MRHAARRQPDPSRDTILDSIADGVFTVDRDWRITSFNAAAEKITGIRRQEAIGQKCWEVFRADICEQACALRRTMEGGKPVVNRTVHIVNASGRRVPISISTAILREGADGVVAGGVETFRDLSEVEELRREVLGRSTFHDIVTRDHRMLRIFDTLPAVAASMAPVLLLGESGTGKELVARAIHDLGPRAERPFVAVNCGALPETLLESELFGYRKGAFTDAKTDKPGRFERAQGGTLLLDEIGDLPRPLQVKLLRVLQEKTFEPLGAVEPLRADVRVVVATNRDLGALASAGEFRKDLFYRVSTLTITLPPLRERRGDIPLLAAHFVDHFRAVYGKDIPGFSDEALAVLMRHDFPGNVRELQGIVEHAFVMCPSGPIGVAHLPEGLLAPPARTPGPAAGAAGAQHPSPDDLKRQRIVAALQHARHRRVDAARELGIHVTTLWRQMKRLGID